MEAKGLALFLDRLHRGHCEIGFWMRQTSGLNWQSYSLVLKKQDRILNIIVIALDKYTTSIMHNFQYIISPSLHEETVFQSMLLVLQECK